MPQPLRIGLLAALCSIQILGARANAQPATESASKAAPRLEEKRFKTFSEWRAACDLLPRNRTLKRSPPPKELLPVKAAEFGLGIDRFLRSARDGELAGSGAWAGIKPVKEHFFNIDNAHFIKGGIRFEPFTQRLIVPQGAEVFFHGDFHGDIHSLNAVLGSLEIAGRVKDFKIVSTNFWMVFLGDYTDRGMYGVEVLHTVLRLKQENPDRVVLVRGNHEDISLAMNYGFMAEAQLKYGREFNPQKTLRVYDFMPVALYLVSGQNAIQCNHGGMEPGSDPRALLDAAAEVRFQFLSNVRRAQFLVSSAELLKQLAPSERDLLKATFSDFIPESPTRPSVIGFMWNDFTLLREEPQFAIDPGRAFIYGDRLTHHVLDQGSSPSRRLRAVFRAHQHSSLPNPMMRRLVAAKGLHRHWQENDSLNLLNASQTTLEQKLESQELRSIPEGSVWTFNVSPDSVYGEGCGFSFDTFGILKTAEHFSDWRITVKNIALKF